MIETYNAIHAAYYIILPILIVFVPVIVVLFVTKDELMLTFTMHWYCAASVSTPEMNSAMPVYCVRLSIMAGLGGVGVVSLVQSTLC